MQQNAQEMHTMHHNKEHDAHLNTIGVFSLVLLKIPNMSGRGKIIMGEYKSAVMLQLWMTSA